jgi:hypothetical protein
MRQHADKKLVEIAPGSESAFHKINRLPINAWRSDGALFNFVAVLTISRTWHY